MGLRTGFTAHAKRLPDRLDDLHGPWQGTVVLPVHLTWHQVREFDVAKQRPRLLLYSIVISQGAGTTWPASSTRSGCARTGSS